LARRHRSRWISPSNGRAAAWAAGLLTLGVATRATRWGSRFPLWADESKVALNLVGRGLSGLTAPLDPGQVMPIGFLAGEILLYESLGPDELSLRLLPFVAALASLVCFRKLSRTVMEEFVTRDALLGLLPLGIFSVSYYLIRYAGELKPYSLDVLFACVFLWFGAASIRRGPENLARTLLAPALLIAPATWLSYPVVFVGAGMSLSLLPSVMRSGAARAWLVFIGFNVALLAGFASHYLLFGPIDSADKVAYVQRFWADSFPPSDPTSIAAWLASRHTGKMFAHPNGGPNGGSTATFLFFLLGAWSLATGGKTGRHRARFEILTLLLAPFVLNLAAASLRLYPYGGHARVALFHAPSICLLGGIGLVSAIERIRYARWRPRITTALLGACVLMGVLCIGRDLAKPYKSERNLANRRLVQEAFEAAPGATPILVLNDFAAFGGRRRSYNLAWYVRRFGGQRIVTAKDLAAAGLTPGSDVVAVFYSESYWTSRLDERFEAWLAAVGDRLSPRDTMLRCMGDTCRPGLRLLFATVRPDPGGDPPDRP